MKPMDDPKFRLWMEARSLLEDLPIGPTRVVGEGGFVIGRRTANLILAALGAAGFEVVRRDGAQEVEKQAPTAEDQGAV